MSIACDTAPLYCEVRALADGALKHFSSNLPQTCPGQEKYFILLSKHHNFFAK